MPRMKWKDLSGEERYRVVEMARRGEVPLKEICASFGVSRQTLYRAMDAADQAARQALEPKPPGRKPKPPEEVKIQEMTSQMATLRRELEEYKMRYEAAWTFLELERMYDRGELDGIDLESLEGKKTTPSRRTRKRKKPRRRR